MADSNLPDTTLIKSTQICVQVEEALPDMLVVSYEFGVKIYKGVLLESTKRNLPFGVHKLNPAFTSTTTSIKPEDDPLYSVNQRFAYTDPANTTSSANQPRKNIHISAKYKHSKMTVRLRPRQVLCSKCKGICNENSENVTKKRKSSESNQSPPAKRSANAPVTRSSHVITNTTTTRDKEKQSERVELRPRQSLLSGVSREVSTSALSGNVNKINIDNNRKLLGDLKLTEIGNEGVEAAVKVKSDMRSVRRTLRKKRLSTEDNLTIDSTEEGKNNNLKSQNNANTTTSSSDVSCSSSTTSSSSSVVNTRTIKICFGPQGEGTVLKIPAQIENLASNSNSNVLTAHLEENIDTTEIKSDPPHTKAARKALKKAKKEAKHRRTSPISSPIQIPLTPPLPPPPPETTSSTTTPLSPNRGAGGGGCCTTLVGSSSPRYTVGSASPRHGLGLVTATGVTSPRGVAVVAIPVLGGRRKRHKVKHKRKHHKEDKDRSGNEEDSAQKLSINLKRLNNTYCAETNSTIITFDRQNDESNSADELVPNFPAVSSCTELPVTSSDKRAVSTIIDANGIKVSVGDVIWGKIHGFPWWPAKILTVSDVTTSSTGGNSPVDPLEDTPPNVQVSWFGSSTLSMLHAHNITSYLDNYNIRYNKKKRGQYKEAIRLASIEAALLNTPPAPPIVTIPTTTTASEYTITAPLYPGTTIILPQQSPSTMFYNCQSSPVTQSAGGNNTSGGRNVTVVTTPLASPREINVIS